MKRQLLAAGSAVLALTLAGAPAHAGAYQDQLSKCLVDGASAEDRAVLIRWMFSALSQNPAVKPMTNLSQDQRDAYAKAGSELFMRLLTETCRSQAVAAMKNEGAGAMEGGFQVLGEVAGRSLMSDVAAAAEMGRVEQYMDRAKLVALFAEAGLGTR